MLRVLAFNECPHNIVFMKIYEYHCFGWKNKVAYLETCSKYVCETVFLDFYHSLGKFSRQQIYVIFVLICMNCQSLFSWKGKKNISNCGLLKFLSNMGGGRVVRRCCVSYITGASN